MIQSVTLDSLPMNQKNDISSGLETRNPFLGHCNHAPTYSPTQRMYNREEDNVCTLNQWLPVLNQWVSGRSSSRESKSGLYRTMQIYLTLLSGALCARSDLWAAAPDGVSKLSPWLDAIQLKGDAEITEDLLLYFLLAFRLKPHIWKTFRAYSHLD